LMQLKVAIAPTAVTQITTQSKKLSDIVQIRLFSLEVILF
jgi:hypothetical protein